MKKKIVTLLSVLLGAFLLPGCLNFESQTMSYHYHKSSDTLRIFQNYRGIFASDPIHERETGELISGSERNQLESVLNGQHTFFFGNWISTYDRKDIVKMQADLKTPIGRKKMELSVEGLVKADELIQRLLVDVSIENGPFYYDADKQLCGVQFITITNCSSLVAAINESAQHWLKGSLENEDASAAEKALVEKFFMTSQPVIQLEDNTLTLRHPAFRADYDKNYGSKSDDYDLEEVEERKRGGLDISFTDDVISFVIGKPGEGKSKRLTLGSSENKHSANFAKFVASQYSVRESLDIPTLARDFLLHGKRVPPSGKK